MPSCYPPARFGAVVPSIPSLFVRLDDSRTHTHAHARTHTQMRQTRDAQTYARPHARAGVLAIFLAQERQRGGDSSSFAPANAPAATAVAVASPAPRTDRWLPPELWFLILQGLLVSDAASFCWPFSFPLHDFVSVAAVHADRRRRRRRHRWCCCRLRSFRRSMPTSWCALCVRSPPQVHELGGLYDPFDCARS